MDDLRIWDARLDDLPRLTAIYNHYVRSSHATFDEHGFEPEDRRTWFEGYGRTGPYRLLVADRRGQVIGYASSSPYRDHAAFRDTVETSVYVDAPAVGQGIGRALYGALFVTIRGQALHRAPLESRYRTPHRSPSTNASASAG